MTRVPWALVVVVLAVTSGFSLEREADLSNKVWVRPLAQHTWLVRSISNLEGFGDVESNGVLVAGEKESLLIDTPATNEQTAVILDWAERDLHRPVRKLIVTHWHQDRIGGIDTAVKRGIPAFALEKTIRLARKHGRTAPEYSLRAHDHLHVSGIKVETFFPGHGHSADNIVVWIPADKVLDGGCFVKSSGATSLGNLQEIKTTTWSEGIEAVRRRYPKAAIVVPGHGPIGGTELLAHTADLLSASTQ